MEVEPFSMDDVAKVKAEVSEVMGGTWRRIDDDIIVEGIRGDGVPISLGTIFFAKSVLGQPGARHREADFIVNSRTYVPRLLATIDQLSQELEVGETHTIEVFLADVGANFMDRFMDSLPKNVNVSAGFFNRAPVVTFYDIPGEVNDAAHLAVLLTEAVGIGRIVRVEAQGEDAAWTPTELTAKAGEAKIIEPS